MADERDRSQDAPSLEPPSLFGRKKRKPAPAPAPPPEPDVPVAPHAVEPAAAPPAVVVQPLSTGTKVAEPPPISPAAPEPAPEPAPEHEPQPQPQPELTGELEEVDREPWLTGWLAAVITGLLVGVVIVVLTAGGLRLCTKVKGTESCGGPGLFLLVAILIVGVLVGAALLRAARVPEPGSTSFLAVGVLSVVTLLFLVGSIFQWWMIIAIPLVSMACYALSQWVTTTYVEPTRD